jgi:DNA ligase (NAD+)
MYKRTVPKECPYCKQATRYDHSPNGIVTLICTNKYCKGILLKKLSSFVGRSGLDIEGLSEKTLEKFIELGYLKCYSDVFTLIEKHGKGIQQLPGFGVKSVEALGKSIQKCKNTTLSKLLVSLNIDNVGKQNATILAQYYNDNANNLIADFETNKNHSELYNIKSFGSVIASSVITYFSDIVNLMEFKDLCSVMNFEVQEETSGTLSGKSFVITGSLETFKNRSELVKCIESAGGVVDSSVKTGTSYLINNDVNSTSSKNKKAKELNIPIISEREFLELLNTETKTKTSKIKLF